MRVRRPASTRPTSTTAVTARTWPAPSPPTRNDFGIAGVAPDATIVNVRAGQDSGYFFLYETVAALTYAGDAGLDVVNMSFYTDPWLFNCDSADDYVSGAVTPEQLAEQALIRSSCSRAARRTRTTTASRSSPRPATTTPTTPLPTRTDATSPDYPPGTEQARTVTNELPRPADGGPARDHVSARRSVDAPRPTTRTTGSANVEISAPGGWFRDFFGTPQFPTTANLVLSSYPCDVAIEEGLADADGSPDRATRR